MVSPLGVAMSILCKIIDSFLQNSDIQIKRDILETKMARGGGLPKLIKLTICQHQRKGNGFKTIIYRHCFPISIIAFTIRILFAVLELLRTYKNDHTSGYDGSAYNRHKL